MEPFQLGNWHIFPNLNQLKLISSSKSVTVPPKVMKILVTLVEHKNEPVSLEELIKIVWANRVVADSSVYQAVAQLRKVLSEDSETEVYVDRISGQGYRIDPTIQVTPIEPEKEKMNYWIIPIFTFSLLAISVLWFYLSSEEKEALPDKHFESLSLARHLLKQTEPEPLQQAKQLYLNVLDSDTNNVEALNGLCNTYRLLAIYDTLSEAQRDILCQPLLEKAYVLTPENPQILASLARQSFEQGNIEHAEKLFEHALALSESDAMIWRWFGLLKRNKNQVKQALSAHKKAFRLAPNDPLVLRGLAYAYLNNRDLPSARKYFERSLIIAPKYKNKALFELDFYSLNQERAANYLAWFDKYQQYHIPKYPAHRLSYVIFLLSLNQIAVAEETLNSLVPAKNIPQHFLLYTKAALAWHTGKPSKALDKLEQRYLLAPEQNHFVMPYLIGLSLQGEKQKALALFEKHFPNIYQLEADLKVQLGNYLTLAELLKGTARHDEYKDIYQRLLAHRHTSGPFPLEREIQWQALNENKIEVEKLLWQLLENGWMPDYNDSIFLYGYYQSLIDEDTNAALWKQSLNQIQSCLWQRKTIESCKISSVNDSVP